MSSNRHISKLIKLFFILAACLLLVFLNPKNVFSPVRNILFTLVYPFQKISWFFSQKFRGATEFIGSISELKKENQRLIAENDSLATQVAAMMGTKKENEDLRSQLGLLPRDEFQLEAGFVIGQDPQSQGSWIMIDKGNSSGIKEGMAVIVSDGILVGRVEEVFEKSSKINLLTSPTSSINVSDVQTGAKGIVRGEFGLGVVMEMVSQTDVLNEGDSVASSGLGGNVPKGLFVGKVQKFASTDDKLFQMAVILPRVRYYNLETVFVIKNYP